MTTNFKLVIEYDGAPFSGWQVQTDRSTVQGELEKNLGLMLNQSIRLTGSGRTDAGVHALGQVANFHADTSLSCTRIQKGINALIKGPLVIRNCMVVDNDFNARFDAISKEYSYHILNQEDPVAIKRGYLWHIKKPLDLSPIKECCRILTGLHDFKSFEGAGSPRHHTRREVFSASFENRGDSRLLFKIEANGFLRFMVRNIVGTLVDVGLLKLTVQDFSTILKAKDRSLAGPTAPPQGLFLVRVNY